VSDPHDTYVLGLTVHREFLALDADGNGITPAGLTLHRLDPPTWTPPGTDLTPAIVTPVDGVTGLHGIDDVPTVAGRHLYQWRSTAPALAVDQVVVLLAGDAARVTLADVTAYLGPTSWDSTAIAGALAAEQSAQDQRCRTSSVYPPDLAEAVMRRVARNLALRGLPLAMQAGDAGASYAPGRDPEIRRLEGPYRRRVVG